jgi:hypothetical protein
MAVLTFPSIVPEIQEFGIQYNTQVSVSPISGITQTVELPGARWKGRLSFTDMTPEESAELKAFLLQLRGSAGRFYYGDNSHTTPFNAVTGNPTVVSSDSRRLINVTLDTSSPELSPGDYIQIGTDEDRELKMILNSALVSGDTYRLTVEPMIRRVTYVGESVVYTNPTSKFLLTSSDQAGWSIRGKGLLSDISIDFVEVY